jgi:plastocyanin
MEISINIFGSPLNQNHRLIHLYQLTYFLASAMKIMKYIYSVMFGTIMILLTASTFSYSFSQTQDSNLASNIFNNKELVVPKNVKNFVILIPNEAHESPDLPKDQRLINQPYVPQNLVVHPGTKIVWFAGDVGHMRKVILGDENSNEIFNSILKFNSASKALPFNQSGKFTYFETKANKDDPNFVMKGSVTVTSPEPNSSIDISKNSLKSNFDSLSIIMIPTKDINKHPKILNENSLNILDQYSFKDLRQTAGGGANQTLLVLGSNGPIDATISTLKKITSTLPYS